jgi:hypothetical protein
MPPFSLTLCIALAAQSSALTPASEYHAETIEGFTILIHPDVLQHKDEVAEMRKELASQLTEIVRVVPEEPLADLRKVRIWVEWEKRPQGAAEFHVSAKWLKANGYNLDKEGCVEIANVSNFVKWSREDQPWMMMHELAHAYHHLVLGVDHKEIDAAYQNAIDRKLYDSVEYIRGGKKKAYATTNAQEYFAELTEAYFGKNDFYPFTNEELRKHDPKGFQLLSGLWGRPREASENAN